MHCKISRQSVGQFFLTIAVVVGAFFVLYLLQPWFLPFIERNTMLTVGVVVLLWIYLHIKILKGDGIPVKGYVSFLVCSMLSNGLIIGLFLVLGRWLEIELSEQSFPWAVCVVVTLIYGILLNIYFCLIERTLLKSSWFIKKR